MAAAALIAARQPSHQGDVASVDAQPEAKAPEKVAMAAQLETKQTGVSKATATAAAAKTYTADASMEHTPAVESVKGMSVESASKAPAVESTPKAADVQNLAPVTIMGCLEFDEETFWLKETSGVDAPKSRSWRSGFLKKHTSPIEIVDAANTLKLPNYVGQRVAATGMLMNREMRVRSLQRVGASCS